MDSLVLEGFSNLSNCVPKRSATETIRARAQETRTVTQLGCSSSWAKLQKLQEQFSEELLMLQLPDPRGEDCILNE